MQGLVVQSVIPLPLPVEHSFDLSLKFRQQLEVLEQLETPQISQTSVFEYKSDQPILETAKNTPRGLNDLRIRSNKINKIPR